MSRVDLIRFASGIELAQSAAKRWIEQLRLAAKAGRNVHAAVSGGRIARRFFAATAEVARESGFKLGNVDFYWADERCVPPDVPESNYHLAQTHLFSPLRIPAERIHRIRGEFTPAVAAREAAADLARQVPAGAGGLPVLDFVFLGMGEDGHVASLFPNEPDPIANSPEMFRPVVVPKPPPKRITMSYGLLGAAREVWVLASGPGKEDALRTSLAEFGQSPLAKVIRSRPLTLVFTDIRRS